MSNYLNISTRKVADCASSRSGSICFSYLPHRAVPRTLTLTN